MSSVNRRTFLQRASSAAGAAAVGSTFEALLRRAAAGEATGENAKSSSFGYGPLGPVKDDATGLDLLRLPAGFRYRSFGWTGEPMSSGGDTPSWHDGMAVIASDEKSLTLCRNHEIDGDGVPFADGPIRYDNHGAGGCTLLTFDLVKGEFTGSRPAISGTVKNCAGGPTPWGSWLTCEETTLGPGDSLKDRKLKLERDHGFIFEVPADRPCDAQPLAAMGRFVHEAIAVDPKTGIVYETEDRTTAGFYRFLPTTPGKLADGGRLEMMKLVKRRDLRRGLQVGDQFDVSWVPIEDPLRPHSPGKTDSLGVYSQGIAQGGATFSRLEGCWERSGRIYIVATDGGDKKLGQVFEYSPADETIRLLFESPGADVLNMPDNITVSRGGGMILCEDSDTIPQRMHGLSRDGRIFPLAENNMQLDGTPFRHKGEFRDAEWAGACFSPDGRWLFVNIQAPGVTFAITGPWEDGPLA